MATAEGPKLGERAGGGPARAGGRRKRPRTEDGGGRERRWAWAGLALVLGGGLALRLWGVRQGLPYAYNADEADHFVPHAVAMFETGTLNPRYFANPPAFTYLLHLLFAIYYGGAHGAEHAFAVDPASVYTLARVAAASLGTVALWLLYLAGARLFNRAVGLLAAAIEAVAFLPVFYAHLALNDAPTLAPATLSLLGSAGVLRKGRPRDYVLAGVGLGLAAATKYTAGIMLVPLLAAVVLRGLDTGKRRALVGLALAGACALAAFLIANPYALLDYSSFHSELVHQSTLSAEAQGKLGAPKDGGLIYYLWSFTWGLGWAPALAALAGAVIVWRHERACSLDARARGVAVPRVHGHRGPLLRPLAASDLPDRVPAGRILRRVARGRRRAGARLARCRPRRPPRGGPPGAEDRLRGATGRARGGARRCGARPGPALQRPLGHRALAR